MNNKPDLDILPDISTEDVYRFSAWFFPAIGALVAWGLWAFIPKLTLDTSMTPYSMVIWVALGNMLVAIPVWFYKKCKLDVDGRGIGMTFVGGLVTTLMMVAYFHAVDTGPVAVVSTIGSMYPILTLIFARIFLKETISKRQLFTILLAMISIILLAG